MVQRRSTSVSRHTSIPLCFLMCLPDTHLRAICPSSSSSTLSHLHSRNLAVARQAQLGSLWREIGADSHDFTVHTSLGVIVDFSLGLSLNLPTTVTRFLLHLMQQSE